MKPLWSTGCFEKFIKKQFDTLDSNRNCTLLVVKQRWEYSSRQEPGCSGRKSGTFFFFFFLEGEKGLCIRKTFPKLIKAEFFESSTEWQCASLRLMAKVWARSVLCSLIITRLIKGELTAASTGLFAHNCRRGGKVAPRKQNQSHISHLSRVPQTGC